MHGITKVALFDGLDNRKTILDCFRRMGRNVTDEVAGQRRAGFLSGLLMLSTNFTGRPMEIEGCPTANEAYLLFLQVMAHLGVDIEKATILLEKAVKHMETAGYGAPFGWKHGH